MPKAPADAAEPGVRSRRAVRRQTVLVVHDDAGTLRGIVASLERLPVSVVGTASGAEALRVLKRRRVDLILMDVRMADLDGYATAQLIREQHAEQRIPIVFVTAFEQAEADIVRGYELGGVDHVFAPIVPGILRAKVSALLELMTAQADTSDKLDELRAVDESAHAAPAATAATPGMDPTQLLEISMHQAKGIAAVFKGYVSLIESGDLGPVPTGAAMALGVLRGKAEELERLSRAVTAAARRGALGTMPVAATTDLVQAGREACRRAESAARLVGGTIGFTATSEPIPVAADADHLDWILDNLLSNAIRHSSHAPRVCLAVSAGPPPSVVVDDEGDGIPEGMEEEIFQPYLKVDGETSGMGLGLYLARRLAELNGGRLELARTQLGVGSSFTLELPPAAK